MLKKPKSSKAIIIISAHVDPLPTSAAKMMSDLAETVKRHRRTYVITQTGTHFGQNKNFGTVYGIRNPFIKSKSNFLRFIFEVIIPLLIALTIAIYLRLTVKNYDIVVYSPTTMQWPISLVLRKVGVKQYLILRDLFPDWLADNGILKKKSLVYKMLYALSSIQYYISDIIACQSEVDINLLPTNVRCKSTVLNSFYKCHPEVDKYPSGSHQKSIRLCYVGSFYKAQDWWHSVKLFDYLLREHPDVSIDFIGSGNPYLEKNLFSKEVRGRVNIKRAIAQTDLDVKLLEYDAGLLTLSGALKNSNIPGKFIQYCRLGLPSIGILHKSSEISQIITRNKLGCVFNADDNVNEIEQSFAKLIHKITKYDKEIIQKYFEENHSVEIACSNILNALENDDVNNHFTKHDRLI